MIPSLNNRWKFKPRHIKVYRWLRFVPLCTFIGCIKVIWWILCGAKPFKTDEWQHTRLETLDLIWTINQSNYYMYIGKYYTCEELIEEKYDAMSM